MAGGWEWVLVFQHGLTALASGYNAFHFLGYRTERRRRRWGAFTLAMVNLAFLVQGLYLGILPTLTGREAGELLGVPRVRFFTGLLPLAASLLILAFVVTGRRDLRNNLKGGTG